MAASGSAAQDRLSGLIADVHDVPTPGVVDGTDALVMHQHALQPGRRVLVVDDALLSVEA